MIQDRASQQRASKERASIEREVIVLVDDLGVPIGTADKLEAHRPPGLLHLAFSVVLYRFDGSLLLQQRAPGKYHFPSFWANACCSHPGPGEELVASAERRVREELGRTAELALAGNFTYVARCPSSGLVEHEFDHVLVGTLEGEPRPEPSEVAQVAWVRPEAIASGAFAGPVTPWLGPAVELAEQWRATTGR